MKFIFYDKTSRVMVLFFIISILSLLNSGCGDSSRNDDSDLPNASSRTGEIAFRASWNFATQATSIYRAQSPSGDVCADYDIDTIACNVYNANGTIVKSQSWPCNQHAGTISGVTTGSGMWLELMAIVSGDVRWGGRSGTFTTSNNNTTAVGSVLMEYIGDDTDPPAVESTTPADGSVDISLDSVISAKFTENVVPASVKSGFSLATGTTQVDGTSIFDPISHTFTFTPDGDLTELTTYTAKVTSGVEDMVGNPMTADYVWELTTTSFEAPSVTTQLAESISEKSAI